MVIFHNRQSSTFLRCRFSDRSSVVVSCLAHSRMREKKRLHCSFIFHFSSVCHFVFKLLSMDTVRSISATKPPERLLKRRLTRASTNSSSNNPPSRKVSLSKASAVTVTTIHRRKSTRMTSKKHSHRTANSPARLNSSALFVEQDPHDLARQMAATSLVELPAIPSSTRTADVHLRTTHSPEEIDVTNEDAPNDESQLEEPASEESLEPISPHRQPTPSRQSSAEKTQFTLESLDILRTVGTGKNSLSRERNEAMSSVC